MPSNEDDDKAIRHSPPRRAARRKPNYRDNNEDDDDKDDEEYRVAGFKGADDDSDEDDEDYKSSKKVRKKKRKRALPSPRRNLRHVAAVNYQDEPDSEDQVVVESTDEEEDDKEEEEKEEEEDEKEETIEGKVVGRRVYKEFKEGWFWGTVAHVRKPKKGSSISWYSIKYDDGDEEEVKSTALQELLDNAAAEDDLVGSRLYKKFEEGWFWGTVDHVQNPRKRVIKALGILSIMMTGMKKKLNWKIY